MSDSTNVLTKELLEFPVYKVRYHSCSTTGDWNEQSFVFIGLNDDVHTALIAYQNGASDLKATVSKLKSVLHAKYGEKLTEKHLVNKFDLKSKNVQYIKHFIFHDDSIATVSKKICVYLGVKRAVSPTQLYMWGQTNNIHMNQYKWMTKVILDGKQSIPKQSVISNLGCLFPEIFESGLDLDKDSYNEHDLLNIMIKGRSSMFKSMNVCLGHNIQYSNAHLVFPLDPTHIIEWSNDLRIEELDYSDECNLLLESKKLDANTIHFTTLDDLKTFASLNAQINFDVLQKIYFPMTHKIKNREKLDDRVLNAEENMIYNIQQYVSNKDIVLDTWPNFVHIRVNELLGSITTSALDMSVLYNHTPVDKTIPFIKYVSTSNTFYKVYKPYIKNKNGQQPKISVKDDLTKWTKFDMARFMKHKTELIVFKLYVGDIENKPKFATILLYENGIYDVKMTFKVSEKIKTTTLDQFVEVINAKMLKVFKHADIDIPLIDKGFWTGTNDTKIVKMMFYGTLTSNGKTLSVSQIDNKLASLFTHMSIISSKHIVHTLYKRVNNYSMSNFIIQYLNNNSHELSKDELVQNIVSMFGISQEEARDEYNSWVIKGKGDTTRIGTKVFYKQKDMHAVSIKIKPYQAGYMLLVSGLTNVKESQRLLHSIKYGLYESKLTNSKTTTKSKKETLTDVLQELAAHGLLDNLNVDLDSDSDEEGGDEQTFFGNFHTTDHVDADAGGEGDDDLISMKKRMECPKLKEDAKGGFPRKKKSNGEDEDKGDGDDDNGKGDLEKRYVLNKLKEADPALFEFQSLQIKVKNDDDKSKVSGKTYSKQCQKTNKRQPIVMSKLELDYNNKCFPGATASWDNFGSTEELKKKNFYTCPMVWCPKSRVGLTMDQFVNVYKRKCPFPNIEETPLSFSNAYFKNDVRYIGYLKPIHHPNNLHMPCCYKNERLLNRKPDDGVVTVDNKVDGKAANKSNEKYIMNHEFPLEEDRIGLMPSILSVFFDNKNCGGEDGSTGHANKKTDCFVRLGVAWSSQPFFQSMVHLLQHPKIKTVDDIVKNIKKHMTVSLFISLNDGLILKKFISKSLDIHNATHFMAFKKWLNDQTSYVTKFNLDDLKVSLTLVSEFSDDMEYATLCKREFDIFNAFTSFLNYIENPEILKTHHILGELFSLQLPWLNVHGYNLIVFEAQNELNIAHISCPIWKHGTSLFKKHKGIMLVINQQRFYEPIIHLKSFVDAKHKKTLTKVIIHSYHDNNQIHKIVDYYHSTCNIEHMDEFAGRIFKKLDEDIILQVLDYNMHVIGLYIKDAYIPFKKPTSMVINHPSTFMIIDQFMNEANVSLRIKGKRVRTMLKELNKHLGTDYYTVISNEDDDIIRLKDNYQMIPLKPIDVNEYELDLDIFTKSSKPDQRHVFSKEQTTIKELHLSLRNELVELLNLSLNGKIDSSLHETVQFLRHSHNPLPKLVKMKLLDDSFKKHADKVMVVFPKPLPDVVNDRLCSKIAKNEECMANSHCSWIQFKRDNKNGHCRLTIPVDYKSRLYTNVLDDLLNPMIPLKTVKINSSNVSNEDMLAFTDQDINDRKIWDILGVSDAVHDFGFVKQPEVINIENANGHDGVVSPINPPSNWLVSSSVSETVPTFLRNILKEFTVKAMNPYNKLWIYDMMADVYNRIHYSTTPMTATMLISKVKTEIKHVLKKKFEDVKHLISVNPFIKHLMKSKDESELTVNTVMEAMGMETYVFSEFELEILASIVNVNVIVVSRIAKTRSPDQIRCLGARDTDTFIMLRQKSNSKEHTDIFEPFIKHETQFYFELNDVDAVLSKCIKAKCRRYSLEENKKLSGASVCPSSSKA